MTKTNPKNEQAIGIDLGTTNCCAAYYSKKLVNIEHDSVRLLPSIILYTSPSTPLVGEVNPEQLLENENTIITNTKRFIGLKFTDPKVKENAQNLPFELTDHQGGAAFKLTFRNNEIKIVTPIEAAVHLLTQIKKNAEAQLKASVTQAVVTIPAHFNYQQREETKLAATTAGFKDVHLLTEPVAAAIAYNYETDFGEPKDTKMETNILVFDLGGGTFDVSILSVVDEDYTVLSEEGNMHLGGLDFDNRLFNHFKNDIIKNHEFDVSVSPTAKWRLHKACEELKKRLSISETASISLKSFSPTDYTLTITRRDFEILCRDLFEETRTTITNAITQAKLKNSNLNITRVILVGGSSLIPYFTNEILRPMFPQSKICKDVSTEAAVAYGAALRAATYYGNLSGNLRQINLRDGERDIASRNFFLGILFLKIEPKPRGEVTVDVTFSINDEGILTVKAQILPSGASKKIRLEGASQISEEEIQRLKDEALQAAAEDEKSKQSAEARTKLEDFIYKKRRTLKDDKEGKAANDILKASEDKIKTNTLMANDLEKELENLTLDLASLGL
ncbi:uncharacterized protein SAPINGB_P002854 [Magnusiomyces paraingens]|uniref:Heat shock protein 70 n=1 Tax=Magnusiomyces paraingens TaxID=2606893 RepID=A0A5E8BI60_9ASCO|nr:uncharacterized protein SAPINGB_P002854 [Saprochaete ingens]VVT50709.1 unnamed protein product [Saprochaete ingens]